MKLTECTRCPLCETRHVVVPGRGNPLAPVVFVGEAPGQAENMKGIPFVGRAGKLLDEFIAGLPLTPDGYYITNAVKCIPLDKEGRIRSPNESEITRCAPWLDKELDKMPWLIITLGRVALGRITGVYEYKQRRGNLLRSNAYHCYVFPLYHPAFILRGNALDAWEADRIRLGAILNAPEGDRGKLVINHV